MGESRTFSLRDRYLILIQKLQKAIRIQPTDPLEETAESIATEFLQLMNDIFQDSVIVRIDDIKKAVVIKDELVYSGILKPDFVTGEKYEDMSPEQQLAYEPYGERVTVTYPAKQMQHMSGPRILDKSSIQQVKDEMIYAMLMTFDKEE